MTFDVTLYTAVKALLRQEQFDVIHLHEPLIPVLPYLVLLNSRSVNVATFHAFRASSPWYTAFKPYMTFMMSRLDARIAVSEPARDFVSQYFHGPYDIVPNGIDVHRFRDVEPFTWARDGIPRILFVGRYNEPRKGFKYLLRAMPSIHQQFPDARLVVVGGGKPDRFDGLMERYGVAMSISSGLSRQKNSRATTQAAIYSALPRSPGRALASCYWKRWRRVDPSLPGTFRGIAAS